MGKKLFSCRHASSPAIKVKTESQPGICQCLLGPKGRFLCPISPKPHQRRTRKEKIEEQRKRKEGKKLPWSHSSFLYWLRFGAKTKLLDGRGLFDNNVFKNSVRYIFIVHEVRNKFVDCKTSSLYGWNPRTIPLTKYPHYSLT